ncbi:AMP-binding protein [Nonomuraea sp. NPDC049421]|uniref:phenylacetate--CoA ligase family protein n=1 Tax=Nonomuraea sp. NPDC049421 TaxID=3155275 RepID=UPI00341DE82A
MLATAARQLRHAATVLRGGKFDVDALGKLVTDLRGMLAELGEPGEGPNELLPGGGVDDPEIRRSMADRRLRQAIRRAAGHTAYYRLWFEQHGVDPAAIGLDQLSQVATTPKSALRGAGPAFVSDVSEPVLMAQTTGTTGTPAIVWFSRYELELAAVLSAISYLMVGDTREHHVGLSCISSRATVGLVTAQRALTMVGAGFIAQGLVDPGIALDRLAAPLHLPGKLPYVSDLYTVPSYLGALVQRAERDGWQAKDFGLRRVMTGAEILTDALRERVRETFGVPVSDVYGMTELVPTTGMVCSEQHLHLAVEQAHFEILDVDADTPVAPGEVGELVATPYTPYRETTLLVRYRTGDLVRRLPDEPYGCELAALPATSRIVGRASHYGGGPTDRDILEVLQAVREVPLPTRYALTGDPKKPDLHVVAPRRGGTLGRIEELATERALPVAEIVLVDTADELPEPCRVRADLYEHSFESSPSGDPR